MLTVIVVYYIYIVIITRQTSAANAKREKQQQKATKSNIENHKSIRLCTRAELKKYYMNIFFLIILCFFFHLQFLLIRAFSVELLIRYWLIALLLSSLKIVDNAECIMLLW